jgi:hypothetical protein
MLLAVLCEVKRCFWQFISEVKRHYGRYIVAEFFNFCAASNLRQKKGAIGDKCQLGDVDISMFFKHIFEAG